MSGLFYPRLALRNLAKNRSTYLPYLLTGTVCVAMYYIMQSISMNEGLMQVPGAAVALALGGTFTPVAAYAFLVFCALYTPCVAAISTVKHEMGSAKAAAVTVALQCAIAWVVAFLVRCIGLVFGVV